MTKKSPKKFRKINFEPKSKKPSLARPNNAQGIREILHRNSSGMTYDNYKTPFYEDQATFTSQSLNKIQEMDLSEKLQHLKLVQEQAKGLEQKIADYQKQQNDLVKQEQNNQLAQEDIQTT